jgi:WD40 repeat protein
VDQRERATARATIAEARRVSARALVEPASDRALLLAVEGVHLWNSPETRANLLTTIQRNPLAAGVIRGPRLVDLDFSPNGQRAVVVDEEGGLTLYDLAARAPIAHLAGKSPFYAAARFSPDGTHVAVSQGPAICCKPLGITLFNAQDLSPAGITYRGRGPAEPAADVAYSPRGDLIAALTPAPPAPPSPGLESDLFYIAVWRASHPDKPIIQLYTSRLSAGPAFWQGPDLPGWIRFSPDGDRLYASSAGPTVELDAATGRQLREFGGTGALALSPDGATIALATARTKVRLVDTATGKQRAELIGHAAAVTDAAFSHDGSLLATASSDQTTQVWDVATGQRLHRLQGHVGGMTAVGFGAGHQLYTSGSDGLTIRWDLDRASGLVRQLFPPRFPHQTPGISLLSPSADSTLFLSAADGTASLLNVNSGALARLPTGGHQITWAGYPPTSSAAYRPDGRRVATVRWPDGTVQLWDVETGKKIASQRSVLPPAAIAFTPDGTRILIDDIGGLVTEYDARTLQPTGRSLDLALNPAQAMTPTDMRTTHGGLVAVATPGGVANAGTDVVLADLDDGRILHRVHITSGRWRLAAASFSPDGRLYAFGAGDGRVGVIDVATGKVIEGSRDPVHVGPVSWVTFSPDNSTLASVGVDGQVTLLETTHATPIARLQLGDANLQATAAYRADGHTLILAYDDGSVISFDTDPTEWERHACEVAGRNLSIDEWHDAFGDRPYRQTCPQP